MELRWPTSRSSGFSLWSQPPSSSVCDIFRTFTSFITNPVWSDSSGSAWFRDGGWIWLCGGSLLHLGRLRQLEDSAQLRSWMWIIISPSWVSVLCDLKTQLDSGPRDVSRPPKPPKISIDWLLADLLLQQSACWIIYDDNNKVLVTFSLYEPINWFIHSPPQSWSGLKKGQKVWGEADLDLSGGRFHTAAVSVQLSGFQPSVSDDSVKLNPRWLWVESVNSARWRQVHKFRLRQKQAPGASSVHTTPSQI